MNESTILEKNNIIKRKSKKKFNISKYIIYAILILWAITTIFPFIWIIINFLF